MVLNLKSISGNAKRVVPDGIALFIFLKINFCKRKIRAAHGEDLCADKCLPWCGLNLDRAS